MKEQLSSIADLKAAQQRLERLQSKKRTVRQRRKQRKQASESDTQSTSGDTTAQDQRPPIRARAAAQVAAAAAAAAADSEVETAPMNFAAAVAGTSAAEAKRRQSAPAAMQPLPECPRAVKAMPHSLRYMLQGINSFSVAAVKQTVDTYLPAPQQKGCAGVAKERMPQLWRAIFPGEDTPTRKDAIPKLVQFVCDNWEHIATHA
jgi:hypothetical protein